MSRGKFIRIVIEVIVCRLLDVDKFKSLGVDKNVLTRLPELSGRTIQLPHKEHSIDDMITETVAAQGAPGKMTWLEDPPPWLKPWLRPA